MEAVAQAPKTLLSKRNIGYAIGGLVILAGGYFLFIYKDKNSRTTFSKLSEMITQKGMTREQAIKVIRDVSKNQNWEGEGYDTDYLVARAKALKKNEPTFMVENKTYNTKSGKAVK